MSLPRYPHYRKSGAGWLDSVPEQWDVKRIKHTTYLKGRVGWKGLTSDEYLDDGYAYLVTGTDFSNKFINWRECHCVDEMRYADDPFIQLRDGDLLITKDGTIGKLALVSGLDRPACLNSGIFLIRPTDGYVTDYMYWVLQSESFKVFCDLSSSGSTIQHLYQNVFEDFAFPVPSLQEQISIARFLDHEISKIDALIASQEKLISLLAEKRQATISQAVTRGLNPNAPMKDSAIAWLGHIPARWTAGKIQSFARRETGHTPSRQHPEYWEDCVIPWFTLADVWQIRDGNLKYVHETKEMVSELGIANSSARLLPAGTVLLSRTASVGYSAIMGCDMATSQDFINWVCGSLLKPEFLLYVLRGMRPEFDRLMMGSTHQTIYMPDVAKLMMTLPPLNEQVNIIGFVDHATIKIDTLRYEAERAIALLKERRSALIAAAVTGQIDVRGAVAQAAVQEGLAT